ncbi:hypothetical protein QJQ45_030034 [Haematococcus lacustris]|nr:hypothetical protein QJQ45_030034 [Haematococcus lacustris]
MGTPVMHHIGPSTNSVSEDALHCDTSSHNPYLGPIAAAAAGPIAASARSASPITPAILNNALPPGSPFLNPYNSGPTPDPDPSTTHLHSLSSGTASTTTTTTTTQPWTVPQSHALLEAVLHSWDKSWMGLGLAQLQLSSSRSPSHPAASPPAPASPHSTSLGTRAPSPPIPLNTQTGFQPVAPHQGAAAGGLANPLGPAPPSPSPSVAVPRGAHVRGAANTGAAQGPPHTPSTAASSLPTHVPGSLGSSPSTFSDAGSGMTAGRPSPALTVGPGRPSSHHPSSLLGTSFRAAGATPPPASRPSSTTPIAVHHPIIPKNAKDSSDFASVFFSPLPYSYLALSRSDSADMLLANSVGSPDITLRGGRLSTATSINTPPSQLAPAAAPPNPADRHRLAAREEGDPSLPPPTPPPVAVSGLSAVLKVGAGGGAMPGAPGRGGGVKGGGGLGQLLGGEGGWGVGGGSSMGREGDVTSHGTKRSFASSAASSNDAEAGGGSGRAQAACLASPFPHLSSANGSNGSLAGLEGEAGEQAARPPPAEPELPVRSKHTSSHTQQQQQQQQQQQKQKQQQQQEEVMANVGWAMGADCSAGHGGRRLAKGGLSSGLQQLLRKSGHPTAPSPSSSSSSSSSSPSGAAAAPAHPGSPPAPPRPPANGAGSQAAGAAGSAGAECTTGTGGGAPSLPPPTSPDALANLTTAASPAGNGVGCLGEGEGGRGRGGGRSAAWEGPSLLQKQGVGRGGPAPPAPLFSSHPAVGQLLGANGKVVASPAPQVAIPSCSLISPLVALPTTSISSQNSVTGTLGGIQEAASLPRTPPNRGRPSLRLVASCACIPHIDKTEKGGEDAYCIVNPGLGAIGVADGVSGWAEEGIDPAAYSRTLMKYCAEALQEAAGAADPREVIRYAHNQTVLAGSSTVCLAVMKPGGQLEVANLGDSGVRVIRNGQVHFASTAQQHQFNMPFQLSHPSIIESPDDADSADVTTVSIQVGDVIVLATDGLYDNMFDDEIAAICTQAMQRRRQSLTALAGGRMCGGGDAPPSPGSLATSAAALSNCLRAPPTHAEAQALALHITRTAHKYARDPHQRTPWSVASCEQGHSWARFFAKGGGKMDDCTVIVALVQEVEE